MAVVQTSWLYKNNARSYPFHDGADPLVKTALVDFHISFPDNLTPPNARVYISQLVVTNRYAQLSIVADGRGTIGTFQIENPQAYRMYQLETIYTSIHGFVSFGDAAENGTIDVNLNLDSDNGRILDSLVYRSKALNVTGFSDGPSTVNGVVQFSGHSGVVCETVDVYYDGEGIQPSLVFRLEHDNQTMVDPIPECNLLLESGIIRNLVSEINGITPTSDGTIFLDVDAKPDYQYDEDGKVILDAAGLPRLDEGDEGRRVLKMKGLLAAPHVIGFVDQYSYRMSCPTTLTTRIVYKKPKCEPCVPAEIINENPFVFSWFTIHGDVLRIAWNYYGKKSVTLGPNVDYMSIVALDGEPAPTIEVSGSLEKTPKIPKLAGPFTKCTHTLKKKDNLNYETEAVVKYILDREIKPGVIVQVSFAHAILTEVGGGEDEELRVNDAYPTCTAVAQSKYGPMSEEEQKRIDGDC